MKEKIIVNPTYHPVITTVTFLCLPTTFFYAYITCIFFSCKQFIVCGRHFKKIDFREEGGERGREKH